MVLAAPRKAEVYLDPIFLVPQNATPKCHFISAVLNKNGLFTRRDVMKGDILSQAGIQSPHNFPSLQGL